MDYTIDEMETLQTANEQKITEIERINNQLHKALEVKAKHPFFFINSLPQMNYSRQ